MTQNPNHIFDNKDGGFGLCPHCAGGDEYLNVGRDHWFICREHKTRWCAGSNLFSSWRDETQAQWDENEQLLKEFKVIKPRVNDFDPEMTAALATDDFLRRNPMLNLCPEPFDTVRVVDGDEFALLMSSDGSRAANDSMFPGAA